MKIKQIPIGVFAVMYILMYAAPAITEDQLVKKIGERIQEFGAESAGVYFEGFDHRTFTHHPDDVYHAASTMKVPVMMEVFRQVEQGKLKLDQGVKVENQFASIIDGSPFSLTKEEDSDTEIYEKIGQTLPLKELVERMINRSSNLSTNLVIQLVSAKKVMELMKQIGAKDMTVLRGVEDTKAYEAGKNNTTSARSLAICLKSILDPKRFSESSRRQMIEILLSQTSRGGIPAGIDPVEPGLKIACKDGWITEINHDSAIIQNQKGQSAILVILTKGAKKEETGVKLVAALAADIWSSLASAKEKKFASFGGVVRDSSGEALPGVTLTLTAPQVALQRSTNTNAEGYFRFADLPSGSDYKIVALIEGFYEYIYDRLCFHPEERIDFEIVLFAAVISECIHTGEAPVSINFKKGKIMDGKHRPLRGAKVTIMKETKVWTSLADKNGNYEFKNTFPFGGYKFLVEHQGYAPRTQELLADICSEVHRLDFMLIRSCT